MTKRLTAEVILPSEVETGDFSICIIRVVWPFSSCGPDWFAQEVVAP